jgi:hypothetical protein
MIVLMPVFMIMVMLMMMSVLLVTRMMLPISSRREAAWRSGTFSRRLFEGGISIVLQSHYALSYFR